ncbi:hypothetical protein WSM22_45100 [Cytophagales bacterium WSM2-2]|nr:hypothetical protein WSM22_45100 [Cytophagales bacterium WSM2-2]
MKRLFTLMIALFAVMTFAKAQDQASLDQAVKDWERAKAYIQEYMDAMPEEGYAFKPTPEMRSFAEQFLHIADANFGFAATISGTKSPLGDASAEKTGEKTKAATMKTLNDSYDFVLAALKGLSADKYRESINFFKMNMTRAVVMGKCFEHQAHHRGQSTVYLRLKGVKPPAEKLF